MLKLFKEIEGIMGVKACLCYIQGLGLVYADLPSEYNPFVLGQIESFSDRQLQAAESYSADISSMEIRFHEATIITKKLDSKSQLIIIAEPHINLGLLDVTFDLLAYELQQAAKDIQKDPRSALTKNHKKTSQPSWLNGELPSTLLPAMQEIYHILNTTIGPLSNVIMNDSLNSWRQVGACLKERINELIDILGMEIGDSVLEARFRKTIQPVLLHLFATNNQKPAAKQKTGKNKIMISTTLAKKLSRIMELFSGTIGSQAPLVMKSKLRHWAASTPPSEQRIPQLIDMLAEEIKDPANAKNFRNKCLNRT